MKIYLFNPDTGVYQGEDFADQEPMRRGCQDQLPSYATAISPPSYGRGEVPVFRADENRWEILPVAAAAVENVADPGEPTDAAPRRQAFGWRAEIS